MSGISLQNHTNKANWDILVNANSIRVGNTIIVKNTNPDYGTVGNGLVKGSNAVTQLTSNVRDTVSYPFRASNGSTLMSKIEDAQFGRFQVGQIINDSAIAQGITSTMNTLGGNIVGGGGLGNIAGNTFAGAGKAVGNAASVASQAVTGFVAFTTETVDKIKKIGEQFDEIIKDTFLGQIFKIKGSEILCAVFCIIISLLPCNARNQLYETVKAIRDGIRTANSVIDGVNKLTANPVEVPLFNEMTIADNVADLFTQKPKSSADFRNWEKINDTRKFINAPKGTQTKSAPVNFEIPTSVITIVQNLIMVLSVLAKGQITLPVGIKGDIWDIAQTVLYVLQTQAIQLADEFMTRVVKRVEDQLKNIMPIICVGNLASIFINKIISALYELKTYLLKQLKELFGAAKGFQIKWKTFGWQNKGILELLAMLKALQLIIKNFPDLAMACGVHPCPGTLDNKDIQMVQEAVRNGMLVKETNTPAGILPIEQLPQGKSLDEIATTLSKMNVIPGMTVIPTIDGFDVVMPDMYKDAPQKIKDMLLTPEFLSELGGAYTLYVPNDLSYVNIVYTYKSTCS